MAGASSGTETSVGTGRWRRPLVGPYAHYDTLRGYDCAAEISEHICVSHFTSISRRAMFGRFRVVPPGKRSKLLVAVGAAVLHVIGRVIPMRCRILIA